MAMLKLFCCIMLIGMEATIRIQQSGPKGNPGQMIRIRDRLALSYVKKASVAEIICIFTRIIMKSVPLIEERFSLFADSNTIVKL